MVSDVHADSVPDIVHAQITRGPSDRSWIDGLADLTGSNNTLYVLPGGTRIRFPDEVQCALDTTMSCSVVDFTTMSCSVVDFSNLFIAQHNAQPDITNRPITTSALTMHQSNEMNLKVTHSLT